MKRHDTSRRSAFTLVEMLVVIGIIVVLVALLIPAGAIAVSRVRDANMAFEIAKLSDAIETYKNKLGDYPPSMGEIDPNTGGSLYLTNPYTSICERHLRKCYPKMTPDEKRNFYANIAPRLNQAEALFFWLTQTQNDEREPFFSPAKNFKAYYDFKQERISETEYITWTDTNVTPNRNYEFKTFAYTPTYAKETSYVYLDSRTYLVHSVIARAAPYQTVADNVFGISGAVQGYGDDNGNYMNLKKFQIICAGQDGEFGRAKDQFNANGTVFEMKLFRSGRNYEDEDKDNLTNFSEGKRLSDHIP